MDVKFPFEYVGNTFFGHVYRPVVKVSLKALSHDIWIDTWMVVDTGADFTILPRHLVGKLRISLEKQCVKDTTLGVGGEQVIYLCKQKVKAKVGSMERAIPLAFFDTNEVPALLGRLGFLETFDTEFLKSHVVVFKN